MKKENSSTSNISLDVKTIFKSLSDEQVEYLTINKTCTHIKKGNVVFKEGSRIGKIYCVNAGILKIYKTGAEGKEQIIKLAKKGDIIGFRSVINDEPACVSAKVIEDAELWQISAYEFNNMLNENIKFAIEMLRVTCKELDESNKYITEIAQKSVKERLAEIILDLQDKFGVNEDGIINISLTREELANFTGTATESIIRFLSEFKTDGILEIYGRRFKILDITRLKKISNTY